MEQHFVPQFYLKSFRDPEVEGKGPWLWVTDFHEKTVELRSPKAVGKRTNYYAFPEAEAAGGESIEALLGKLESAAAPVVKNLIASDDMPLEKQARADLLFFMAAFVVRVPFFRDILEDLSAQLAKTTLQTAASSAEYFERTMREAFKEKQAELTPEKIAEYRQFILDDSRYRIRASPKLSIAAGLEATLDTIYPIFDDMRWAVARPDGHSRWITSDAPVSWVDPTLPIGYRHGLAAPHVQVTFPVSPSVCIVGTWDGPTGSIDVDDQVVEEFNIRRVGFADRYAFAHTQQRGQFALDVRHRMEESQRR